MNENNDVMSNFIEIDAVNSDSFFKVKETLTRMRIG